MNFLSEGSKSHSSWELLEEDRFYSPFSLASKLWVPASCLQMTFTEVGIMRMGSKHLPADCSWREARSMFCFMCLVRQFFLEACLSHSFSYHIPSCLFSFMLFVVWLCCSCLGPFSFVVFLFKKKSILLKHEKCWWVGIHWKTRTMNFQFRALFKTHLRNICIHQVAPVESN